MVATLRPAAGVVYPLAAHRPGILLINPATTEAVGLNYHDNLAATADAAGNLSQITLTIPAGTAMPPALEAVVIVDVFPLHRKLLQP